MKIRVILTWAVVVFWLFDLLLATISSAPEAVIFRSFSGTGTEIGLAIWFNLFRVIQISFLLYVFFIWGRLQLKKESSKRSKF